MTNPTAERREANSQQQDDSKTLKYVMDILLVLKDDHPVRKAVELLGTDNINDLTSLTSEEIRTLHYEDQQGNIQPIPIHAVGLFRTLRRLTHFYISNGKTLDWTKITRNGFRSFQISPLNDDDPKPPRVSVELAGIIVDPSYQPTPPPPPTSIPFDAVRDFKKGIKRDQTLFPVLNRDQGWHKFHQDFLIEAKAQGVEDILNPNYQPSNPIEQQLFLEKQKFMTAVLKRTFMTNKGKSIITMHASTSDAQTMYKEAEIHYTKGAHAEADSEALLNYLITSRLNDGKWKGTAEDYLLHWEKQVVLYNDKSRYKIAEMHQRQYLQNAVAGIPELAAVKNTAATIAKTNNQAITFLAYMELLMTAAQQYDISLNKIHPTNPRRPRRDAHQMMLFEDEDDYEVHYHDAVDHHDFDTPIYNINNNQQYSPNLPTPRPRLPLDIWRSLSKPDKHAWNQLTNAGKFTLLKHFPPCTQSTPPTKASPSPSRPPRSIHASDIESFISVYQALAVGSNDNNGDHNQDDDHHHNDNQEQEDQEELYAMLTKSKKATTSNPKTKNIPGNISRLLSPKPKKPNDQVVKG